jgi:ketosteroid isomerase-like protein
MTDNIAFVQSLYAAFGRGDIDTIIAGLAGDIDWLSIGRPSDFATFGPRRGPGEVREFFDLLARDTEFSEFSPNDFDAVGDKVFVEGHSRMRLKAGGPEVDTDWAHIFTIKGGKVARFRDFTDTAQTAEAAAKVRALEPA